MSDKYSVLLPLKNNYAFLETKKVFIKNIDYVKCLKARSYLKELKRVHQTKNILYISIQHIKKLHQQQILIKMMKLLHCEYHINK